MFIKIATSKELILINLRNVVTIETRATELVIVLSSPTTTGGSYRLSYTCPSEEVARAEFNRLESELTQLGEICGLPGSKVV